MSDELILGKYKDISEFESAYKSLKNQYDGLAQTKNKFSVPNEYVLSEEFKLIGSDIVENTTNEARKYGYTQEQFESKLKSKVEKTNQVKSKKDAFDKKYGEEMSVLSSYIKEEVGLNPEVLYSLSDDEIGSLRKNRENSLKSNTSVGSTSTGSFKVTKDDAHKAFKEMQAARQSGDSSAFEYSMNRYKEIIGRINA